MRASDAAHVLTAAVLLAAADAAAQYTDYSQAYQSMVRDRPNLSAGTDRYLYNKYYAHNPAVSPYISGAILGGTNSGTGYTAVTAPELARREANSVAQSQYIQQRKLQGNVGYTAYPGAGYYGAPPGAARLKPVPPTVSTPSAYQNHWYGNWAR